MVGEHRVHVARAAKDAMAAAVPLRRDSVGLCRVWVRVLAGRGNVNHLV